MYTGLETLYLRMESTSLDRDDGIIMRLSNMLTINQVDNIYKILCLKSLN